MRVASISGSIDSIFILLEHEKEDDEKDSHDYTRQGGSEAISYRRIDMHILGLRILKNLAKDHTNCAKIGNTRGLLARLVSYIDTDTAMLTNKREIAKLVFTVANVRNIIEYGHRHVGLQKRAIDILSGLALDNEIREMVGRSGGIIRNLSCSSSRKMFQGMGMNFILPRQLEKPLTS